jgi:hypothetical protein
MLKGLAVKPAKQLRTPKVKKLPPAVSTPMLKAGPIHRAVEHHTPKEKGAEQL